MYSRLKKKNAVPEIDEHLDARTKWKLRDLANSSSGDINKSVKPQIAIKNSSQFSRDNNLNSKIKSNNSSNSNELNSSRNNNRTLIPSPAPTVPIIIKPMTPRLSERATSPRDSVSGSNKTSSRRSQSKRLSRGSPVTMYNVKPRPSLDTRPPSINAQSSGIQNELKLLRSRQSSVSKIRSSLHIPVDQLRFNEALTKGEVDFRSLPSSPNKGRLSVGGFASPITSGRVSSRRVGRRQSAIHSGDPADNMIHAGRATLTGTVQRRKKRVAAFTTDDLDLLIAPGVPPPTTVNNTSGKRERPTSKARRRSLMELSAAHKVSAHAYAPTTDTPKTPEPAVLSAKKLTTTPSGNSKIFSLIAKFASPAKSATPAAATPGSAKVKLQPTNKTSEKGAPRVSAYAWGKNSLLNASGLNLKTMLDTSAPTPSVTAAPPSNSPPTPTTSTSIFHSMFSGGGSSASKEQVRSVYYNRCP